MIDLELSGFGEVKPDISLEVRIKTIPELATRTAALRSGEVHVAKDVAVEELDAINKSGRALAKTTPSNRIPYYVMEVRKPPCNNKLLR